MSGIQETYPPTIDEAQANEMGAPPQHDTVDELALEVFDQMSDRLENLERKYGEQVAERAVEMLHDEYVAR